MTSNAKIIIGVIVVIIVAAGLHYWYVSSTAGQTPEEQGTAVGDDSTALPSGSDNSDAALDQDMTSINGQLQASNSDSAAVDQSVNAAAAE